MSDLLLFIGGVEWIILLFFGLMLVLGTDRLPKFARSIGKVVGEFQKARSDMEKEIAKVNNPISISVPGPVENEREKLEAIATALEINTEGRTDNDLRRLISERVNPKADEKA